MARPMTCADRTPKAGDLIGGFNQKRGPYSIRVLGVDEQRIRLVGAHYILLKEAHVAAYVSRADGGPVVVDD